MVGRAFLDVLTDFKMNNYDY
ncbi:MAG: hypothetical protein FWG21_06345, partial [Oscillospiraceae bacterium]|nr:hypothetical protein [Oscillospiraceae bacterium]